MTEEESNFHMLYLAMTQYALEKLSINSNKQGKAAVTKELTQLHFIDTFSPVYTTKLNKKN